MSDKLETEETPTDTPLSIRVDPDMLVRIDKQVDKFRQRLDSRMSRSNVIRIILSKGLEQVEGNDE